MKYTMQIMVDSTMMSPTTHIPVMVETISMGLSDITDKEINMVAEAFKAQVKDLIVFMARK